MSEAAVFSQDKGNTPGFSPPRAIGWVFAVSRVTRTTSAVLAALALLALVMLGAREVVGRYFFNSPTGWADQFIAYAVAILATGAAAMALRNGSLVSVEVVIDRLPVTGRRVANAFSSILTLLGAVALSWYFGQFVARSYDSGTLANGLVPIPMWIPQSLVLVGLVTLAIEALAQVVQQCYLLVRR
ncbi:MAG: TRAP transporter small permease subunit [Candidatus Nanopelagicales bacterium]